MKLIFENWKKFLTESMEYRELDSPLTYVRSGKIKRLAICDTSVTEPPSKHDTYFAEIEKWRKFSKGRKPKRLKNPVLDEIIPGVSDICIVGFLDFHSHGRDDSWYIDYMKTRGEHGGQGIASQLVDEFFNRYAKPGGMVHFGKIMRKEIWHLKNKMAEKYPDMTLIGGKNF